MFRGSWIIIVTLFASHLNLAASSGNVPETVAIPNGCLNGAYNKAGTCVCNPGFREYQGNCVRASNARSICPPGSVMWNGICRSQILPPIQDVVPAQETYIVVPPLRVTLPIPQQPDPLDPTDTEESFPDDEDGEETGDPVYTPPIREQDFNITYKQIVNNHNVIHNETVHNTHNVNNVIVTISRKNLNGAFRTVVIRNNVTTVHEEPPREKQSNETDVSGSEDCTEKPTTTTEEPSVQNLPCCTIVSPRVCQKQTDEWVCFHRKQYVCSKVCTAKVMYLRPRKPRYRHPWLIMPPMTNYYAYRDRCQKGQCPPPDCSGCLRGRTRCHPMCYTYDCMKDNSCTYIDQELICGEKSGQICALLEDQTINLLVPQNQTKPLL
ncbi:uncharacterized protein LOC126558349 [Anopheles maculipalpis]|uniref:uncharacterized protein LOC126558349 n=1 Tax=Anopheles maculipalpis TaxID=1496333 RepID=UPI0021594B68|nr:uncharacterized protein LOC126558349 [Anopheles maculipalpis]